MESTVDSLNSRRYLFGNAVLRARFMKGDSQKLYYAARTERPRTWTPAGWLKRRWIRNVAKRLGFADFPRWANNIVLHDKPSDTVILWID